MFSLVPSLLNTNENLAWQGNEKSLHQRGGRGGGWENFGTRTLNLSKPRKSLGLVPHLFPSPIYFLLFDWQLDKHTNVYLVRTKVTKTKRANLTANNSRSHVYFIEGIIRCSCRGIALTKKGEDEKNERRLHNAYTLPPSPILSPKINSKIENQV